MAASILNSHESAVGFAGTTQRCRCKPVLQPCSLRPDTQDHKRMTSLQFVVERSRSLGIHPGGYLTGGNSYDRGAGVQERADAAPR